MLASWLRRAVIPSRRAMTLTPPQAPPAWHTITPASLKEQVDAAISRSRAVQDRVAALSGRQASFESVIKPLADDEAAMDTETGILEFLQHVSPHADLREASLAADKVLRDFGIESSMRLDVFAAIKAADHHTSSSQLDAESRRLLDRMLRDGRRAGLDLPEDKRTEVSKLKKEIAEAQVDWQKYYTEESGSTRFSKEELQGVPDSILSELKTEDIDGKTTYVVTNKTPDVLPVLDNASRSETRKTLSLNYENRLADASGLFKRILALRKQLRRVLGYNTWADYVIEVKMAKDAKTAIAFLDDLLDKLTPIGKAERTRLLKLKKELEGGEQPELFVWDWRYLDNKYKERHLNLDEERVKEFFPVDVVVDRIFKIYERVLSVRFEKLEGEFFHEDVSAFSVWEADANRATDGNGFLGYLYLDLYPRPAKYGHAAVWGLVPGYEKSDGTRNYPVAAMVANLAKPTPHKPALLKHDQVNTFFHEMGHAFHQLCSRTRYSRFHGTHVARDFVEAPSQMLENWTFTANELRSMSSHYQTGEPLPDDLIETIRQSELVNGGLFNLRQLFFGKFDLLIHTSEEDLDLDKLWSEMREQISLVSFAGEYRPGYASFGHLVSGYDSGYYGYLYSQAFSVDMFKSVFSKDPMDPAAGARYRQSILLPGGSRDEMDSLIDFLGRPPSNTPFMEKLLSGAPKDSKETSVHL